MASRHVRYKDKRKDRQEEKEEVGSSEADESTERLVQKMQVLIYKEPASISTE